MWTERLQDAVQHGLAESDAARQLCARLGGRSLGIEVRHTSLRAVLRSDGRTLHLDTEAPAVGSADARVNGSIPALLAMAGARRRELVAQGVVTIDGDLEIAEQYARLLQLLRPDPEALLARALGRAPAHLLMSSAEAALTQGSRMLGHLAASGADYLAHEQRALLSHAEAQHFYRQVDELQARVARLEARLVARRGGADP